MFHVKRVGRSAAGRGGERSDLVHTVDASQAALWVDARRRLDTTSQAEK
jgi:hypothetical protein